MSGGQQISNAQQALSMEQPHNQSTVTTASGTQELRQIQEILFGHQQRSNEEQIDALKNALNTQIQALREEIEATQQQTAKRLDSIETLFNKKLQSQHDDSQHAIASIEDKLSRNSKANHDTEVALMASIKETSQKSSEELTNTCDALSARFDKTIDNLQQAKIDRQALSGLMNDLASKLGGSE